MQNKLQELTDMLFQEGLSKGKAEGDSIVANAVKEAEDIVSNAKMEAEAIIGKAVKEAEALKTQTESDVKMASLESISQTKQQIETLVVSRISEEGIRASLCSADFVKEILRAVVASFNKDEAVDLDIVLPESLKEQLETFVNDELSKEFSCGMEFSYSKKISGGFNIGPKDGGYFISMSDKTFYELICSYLRPAAKKLLFG